MSAYSGKLCLLKLDAVTIATARNLTFTIANSVIDTSNKSTGQFASAISSTTTVTMSCDAVFTDSVYDGQIAALALSGLPDTFSVVNANGDIWAGEFFISNFSINSSYSDAIVYSISLQNSGIVTFTAGV